MLVHVIIQSVSDCDEKMITSKQLYKAIFVLILLGFSNSSFARCDPRFISPLDISWNCIYPITFGGVSIRGPGGSQDETNNPVCYCPPNAASLTPRAGIRVGFWEPVRAIETVKDPFCFPTGGLDASSGAGMNGLGGTLDRSNNTHSTFAQAHYLYYALFEMLDIFLDIPCISQEGFDIAWIGEVDPSYQSDVVGLFMSPEALLFANPISALACMPDAAAASVGSPLDALFWCMGTWGNTYPLTGTISGGTYVEENAGLAARTIFRMARTGLLVDRAMDSCEARITPIWRKSHYKLQLMAPVAENRCHNIGESGALWDFAKNPPGRGQDNFSWLKWRKVNCCMTVY